MLCMYFLHNNKRFSEQFKDAIRVAYPQLVNENNELILEYLPVSDEITITLSYGELCFNGVEVIENAYRMKAYLEIDGKRTQLAPLSIPFDLLESYNGPER